MAKVKSADIAPLEVRETFPDWCEIATRYSDQDPNRHINNTAICQYVEEARVSLRQRHYPAELLDEQVAYVVASFRIRFLRAILYPASLMIGNVVTRIGTKSYTLAHGVFLQDGLAAVGRTVTVTCNIADGSALEIPPPVSEQLRKLATTSDEVIAATEQV